MGTEFGKSMAGGEIRTLMSYFVKHRSENNLPTIICSNLSRSEFQKVFGSSIYSVVTGDRFVNENLIDADWRQNGADD
jgi:hypothetical protein